MQGQSQPKRRLCALRARRGPIGASDHHAHASDHNGWWPVRPQPQRTCRPPAAAPSRWWRHVARKPETSGLAPVLRNPSQPRGAAATVRIVAPRPAPKHRGDPPVTEARSAQGCRTAPFPHVAMHLVESPSVRWHASHWHGRVSADTDFRSAFVPPHLAIHLQCIEYCGMAEWRGRSRSARVLPFRLVRQAEPWPASLGELQALPCRHVVHRMPRRGRHAGV